MPQAYLQDILEKDTKAGKMYDLVFSDGTKVGAGKYPPKNLEKGGYYNYEFTVNGNFKNLTSGSMSKIAAPQGIAAPAAPAPSTTSYGGRTASTQDVISRQAAANTAIEFVRLLVEADALPIPKTAKSDRKADLLEEITKVYMAKFHAWNVHKDFDFGASEEGNDPLDLKSLEDPEQWTE